MSSPNNVYTASSGLTAALDLGACGLRASVLVGSQALPIDLRQIGLSPTSLHTMKKEDSVPSFPNLLDRLGEDCPVSFASRNPQKSHFHLRDLLTELRSPLDAWWGPFQSLSIVVSAYANDLQRALLMRAASAAGWTGVRLVNKTTALAIHALQQRPAGNYLSLVIGHGPAEASVFQWQERRLQTLSYSIEPKLAGDELDRWYLQQILRHVEELPGAGPTDAYNFAEWTWMRNHAELVRWRLNLHKNVILELPSFVSNRTAQEEVVFDRRSWEQALSPACDLLGSLIERCCREAGTSMQQLDGFVATGGLLMHFPFLDRTRELCQNRLDAYGPDAQLLGACELAGREAVSIDKPTFEALQKIARKQDEAPFRIAISDGERLTNQVGALERQTRTPEGGLLHARESLNKPQDKVGRAPAQPAAPPTPSMEISREHASNSVSPSGSVNQREYTLAKKYLRQADSLLNAGEAENAVRLSHKARQVSSDSRIFRTMIEVHLRAANQHVPTPQNFADHRRWLLCALADDGTSYLVQKAVTDRFIVQAKQMLEQGTKGARAEAVALLEELLQYVPMAEEAQQITLQLEAKSIP